LYLLAEFSVKYGNGMIIVEGPDGAGKTTLIRKLSGDLKLPVHQRSANSDGSPTSSQGTTRGERLAWWAFHDVRTMSDQPMSIYDRHCLISEYIYGPVVRGHLAADFQNSIIHLTIRLLAKYSLVVFCRPPDDEIGKNLWGGEDGGDGQSFQMEGVRGRWKEVVASYDAMRMFWPGDCMTYDYTNPKSYNDLLAASRIHIGRFQQIKENNR
jgi:hypothetical protein